jgi:hypothetical protein
MVSGYAIIENGVVTNMALAEEGFAAEQGWVLPTAGATIGWLYADGVFSPPASPAPTSQEAADAESAMIARATRNTILTNLVDPIVSNPLRWADMTADQQAAWTAYRRALLDITQQLGFPNSIIWPLAPAKI